ncbi:MAG: phosphotransferase [Oscillospiraceae bacterium]|nr:phosphotransferase [Oscillospiraceae bacterium]
MNFKKFDSITEINKGYSGDKKYCAVKDGTKYLLRISPRKKYKNRKKIHKIMKKLAVKDISMCKPLKVGLCQEGTYILQSWVDGVDAEENIRNYEKSKQYDFGFQSGKILQKIHSIPAPKNQQVWEERFNAKMDRKIKMYRDCPIKFDGAEYIIDYLNVNRSLLKNRPQCFQHGDYHVGNMMIENDKIVIIDFDRYDFGDPWEEFNRIVWAAQTSPEFASGMIDGYFDNDVPGLFWKLLKLYIGSNTLSSVPWAIEYGGDQVDIMLNQAKDVLEWYDNYKLTVPKWYIKF